MVDIVPDEIQAGFGQPADVRILAFPTASGAEILRILEGEILAGDVAIVDIFGWSFYQGLAVPETSELASIAYRLGTTRWIESRLHDLVSGLRIRSFTNAPLPLLHNGFIRVFGGPGNLESASAYITRRVLPGGRIEFNTDTEVRRSPAPSEAKTADIIRQKARPDRAARFAHVLTGLVQLVSSLEARGVRVYFVRMPSDGLYREVEETYFPRSEYWDRLAAALPEKCVHADAVSGSEGLFTPDGSHLEIRSARRFSRWLGKWLKNRLE